ncbi:MAG: hypothetical protein WC352_01605 [Candidatus Omnitrophota bacterium]
MRNYRLFSGKIRFAVWAVILAPWLLAALQPQALAAASRHEEGAAAMYPGLGPIQESEAFKQYVMRPKTELSKLFYLIDRFGAIDADIRYDGIHYRSGWVAAFARMFIPSCYHHESAKDWIMKWCNRGVLKGDLVWVELPNKKLQLAREVLLSELKALEALPPEALVPPPPAQQVKVPPTDQEPAGQSAVAVAPPVAGKV